MAYKNAKLQQQYAEGAAKLAGVVVEDPQLFRGVAIHVNGLTNPSHLVRHRALHFSLHVLGWWWNSRQHSSAGMYFGISGDVIDIVCTLCAAGAEANHGTPWGPF